MIDPSNISPKTNEYLQAQINKLAFDYAALYAKVTMLSSQLSELIDIIIDIEKSQRFPNPTKEIQEDE